MSLIRSQFVLGGVRIVANEFHYLPNQYNAGPPSHKLVYNPIQLNLVGGFNPSEKYESQLG